MQQTKNQSTVDDEFKDIDKNEFEARRIEQEVQKRKAIVLQRKIDQLIQKLYFGQIEYYPIWVKRSGENLVPKIIETATENETNRRQKETTIKLNNKNYKFIFEKHNYTLDEITYENGALILYCDDKKIFGLNLSRQCENGPYSTFSEWKMSAITCFVDGDWVTEFESLLNEAELGKKRRAISAADKKTEQLKNDFGII